MLGLREAQAIYSSKRGPMDLDRPEADGAAVVAARLSGLASYSWRSNEATDHASGQAVMVAQIDEQQAVVIADAMATAGEPNVDAVLGEGQGAAGVGAVAMHDRVFFASNGVEPRCLSENGRRGKREIG